MHLRSTENLSLRLDPEVIRLARRTAEEQQQSLRDFFEAALRQHIAAVTAPEERGNLLSAVEEAFLRRLDERLRDTLERVAALSAKEALYQAHTLQVVKRILLAAIREQTVYKSVINETYNEAVAKVAKRGRPVPLEVIDQLQQRIGELEEAVSSVEAARQRALQEVAQANNEIYKLQEQSRAKERDIQRLEGELERLDFEVRREMWVGDQLEKQGMNPIRRKTAAELRAAYKRDTPANGGGR